MAADFYAILGVSKSASTAEIRKAYASLARDKHPDRFSDPVEKDKAQKEFKALTEAFNTLSNERERGVYDRSMEKPKATTPEEMAKEAFLEGQNAIEAGNLEEAIARFRAAVHLMPGEVQYLTLLARSLARSSQTAHQAVDTFERAIKLQPQKPALYIELANLLLKLGLRLRSRKVAESALLIAPNDPQVLSLAADVGVEDLPPRGKR